MSNEPQSISIKVNDRDSVTALLYPAAKKERVGITLILGHGAGINQLQPFMRLFAEGLAARGLDVLTFNFIYMEQGRSVPDPKPKLESCYRVVIGAALKHKKLKGNRLAIGGKSMGGRIASQVAAAGLTDVLDAKSALPDGRATASILAPISALVFLGYPLHPPGRPDKLRDAHLPDVDAPMLFIQGSRDAFGTEEEIRAVIKRLKLNATLHAIAGGDHSLKIPKSAGVQAEVYENTMDEISRWLRSN
jgi:predicted alpha/beta-hydrolase family hydrolase